MPAAEIAFTSAGTRIFISLGAPTAITSAAFASKTYTEIGEVDEIPEFGAEFSVIKRTPLASRLVKKLKGSKDTGSLMLKAARVPGDDGHADCIAALDDDGVQSFYILLSDDTKMYFTALVTAYKTSIGGAESFTGATIGLEIDSDVVEVAPT